MSNEECIKKVCAMNTAVDIGLNQSNNLKHLPHWPPVNIEFQDILYSVPDILGNFCYYYFHTVTI